MLKRLDTLFLCPPGAHPIRPQWMPETWYPRAGVQRSRSGEEVILEQVLGMAGGGEATSVSWLWQKRLCLAGSTCHFASCPGGGHTPFLTIF